MKLSKAERAEKRRLGGLKGLLSQQKKYKNYSEEMKRRGQMTRRNQWGEFPVHNSVKVAQKAQ